MAPTIAPKIGPTLRTGVGSTAGAIADGSPAAEGGLAAAKCQMTAGGKVPRVSLNLDGARRCSNPPRLATANAAVGTKGLEVIPSDNDNKFSDEGTLLMTSRPRKVGHTMPGKAAKLFVKAPSAKARDFAVRWTTTIRTEETRRQTRCRSPAQRPRRRRTRRHSPTTSSSAAELYDASATMMPAPRRQQWQWRQGNVRDDASAVTATMLKRRQGDGRDDASAAMRPAPQQR
jgi:hypothetical protein